jgi:disulfide bond formation protein DsbB
MNMSAFETLLNRLFRPAIYWTILLLGGLLAEAVALYFQYALDYGPCVLCIHIRLWVAALILVALAGLAGRRCAHLQKICQLLNVAIALGFTERSWRTLAIERNWIESSCSLESGLPTWFAPDQWWPWMFEIWESCGYTPEVLGHLTMAELLAGASVVFLPLAALGLIRAWRRAG